VTAAADAAVTAVDAAAIAAAAVVAVATAGRYETTQASSGGGRLGRRND
jgi:hypothetical protein